MPDESSPTSRESIKIKLSTEALHRLEDLYFAIQEAGEHPTKQELEAVMAARDALCETEEGCEVLRFVMESGEETPEEE